MRRTLFYLTIALLTFGIGSFLVFNFYWKQTDRQLPIIEQPKTELTIENDNAEEHSFTMSDDEATDEKISDVIDLWLKKKNIKQYEEIKSDEFNGI